MMVSTKGRYALTVMLDLAQQDPEKYISLREVAERQNISMKYLESIISTLNRAGIVRALRGKGGGYKLNRAPKDCSVGEILLLTEGSLAPVYCLEPGCGCDRSSNCVTYPMWQQLDRLIDGYLSQISIEDLLHGRIPLSEPQEPGQEQEKTCCSCKG
ncbi:MAG: Rrf2 family transcriptional regulator [Ruminococcaceae bacterium]|nr:Rrf2 family transcriptional regulator [Oscillospiraceae bacterium]